MIFNENELDQEIKTIWEYPVYDGITSIKNYRNAKFKILWILKEANKKKPKETWCQRELHLEVSEYKKWRATYQKIIYTSYGILYNISKLNNIPDISGSGYINKINVMKSLAVVNINKNGGTSRSDNKKIKDSYIKNKKFILDQINLLEPNIIINASRVYELFEDLCGDNKIKYLWKFQYSITDNNLIINCYHPNALVKESKYCNTILKIVNEFFK